MLDEEILMEIEALAAEMGVRIRYEKGDFDGGYCILRDERLIVVNKKLNPVRKASVIGQGLNQLGLENVYVKPAVRLFIDDELSRLRKP
ncbi:MAG: hypothetical protein ACM3Q4_11665 [Acidobacteriota bacterium]